MTVGSAGRPSLPLVVCYGGTFDPVHLGHLGAVRDVLARTGCDQLRLIPCHVPPHRGRPGASGAQRAAMLRLATTHLERVRVDSRELEREGPSYTVDTLASLRAEFGERVALAWVLGTDALAELDRWHEWRRLVTLAHLLVLDRPGAPRPEAGAVAELVATRTAVTAGALRGEPAGRIWFVHQRPVPVAATEVRAALASGRPAGHLLPRAVWAYIRRAGLYLADGPAAREATAESE